MKLVEEFTVTCVRDAQVGVRGAGGSLGQQCGQVQVQLRVGKVSLTQMAEVVAVHRMILRLSKLAAAEVKIAMLDDMSMAVPGPDENVQTVPLEFLSGLLGFEAEVVAV